MHEPTFPMNNNMLSSSFSHPSSLDSLSSHHHHHDHQHDDHDDDDEDGGGGDGASSASTHKILSSYTNSSGNNNNNNNNDYNYDPLMEEMVKLETLTSAATRDIDFMLGQHQQQQQQQHRLLLQHGVDGGFGGSFAFSECFSNFGSGGGLFCGLDDDSSTTLGSSSSSTIVAAAAAAAAPAPSGCFSSNGHNNNNTGHNNNNTGFMSCWSTTPAARARTSTPSSPVSMLGENGPSSSPQNNDNTNCSLFGFDFNNSSSKSSKSNNVGTTFLQTSSFPIRSSSPSSSVTNKSNTSTTSTKAASAAAATAGDGSNPMEATDKVLSAELQKLTLVEREKVTEDIHGIAEVIDETRPNFVTEKIQSFNEEIIKLRRRHARITTSNYTVAYEKALFLNPQLVENDIDFKLMFLRGDNFDTEKAANRYMMYFTTKLELFGLDKLTKQPITLDDLSEEDKKELYTGSIQPLPLKDRAGRRVMAVFPKHAPIGSNESSFRAMWYLFMACIEHDVEVQRRGCVDIFYLIGGCVSNLAHAEPSKTDIPRKFHQSLPRRVVAMHAVYSDPMMGPFMILLPYLVSKFKLARFRSHYGSHMEVTYALNSFGIPAELLPVDQITGCEMETQRFHDEYLSNRRQFEDQLREIQAQREEVRVVPTSKDVLLGRGRPFQFHVGNMRLAALIDQHRSRYTEAGSTYGKKNLICDEIVDLIHESGGRFLKQKDSNNPLDGWEVVRMDVARDKVSHSFRTTKRTKRSNS